MSSAYKILIFFTFLSLIIVPNCSNALVNCVCKDGKVQEGIVYPFFAVCKKKEKMNHTTYVEICFKNSEID